MRVLNFYGLSYHFMPTANVVSNNVVTNLITDLTIADNKIIFFDGVMPAIEDIYNITSEAALLGTYGDKKVMEVGGLTFVYTYDKAKKEKKIKKIPVDAIDLTFEINATIGWAAVILNDDANPTASEKIILFTDSIGTWGDQVAPIIIDKYTGIAGDNNIFKDFSLILRDISTNEGA